MASFEHITPCTLLAETSFLQTLKQKQPPCDTGMVKETIGNQQLQ